MEIVNPKDSRKSSLATRDKLASLLLHAITHARTHARTRTRSKESKDWPRSLMASSLMHNPRPKLLIALESDSNSLSLWNVTRLNDVNTEPICHNARHEWHTVSRWGVAIGSLLRSKGAYYGDRRIFAHMTREGILSW